VIGTWAVDHLVLVVPHSGEWVRVYDILFCEIDRHLPYLHGLERLFLAGGRFQSGAGTLLEANGKELRPMLWGELPLKASAGEFDGKSGLLSVVRIKGQRSFIIAVLTESHPGSETPPSNCCPTARTEILAFRKNQ
jgi:hypothetical protein